MWDGFNEGRARLGDAEIYYRTGGSGPPLLLLHGYPQTHFIWHKVAPILARSFTLVMPDLRGYGRSRGPVPDAGHLAYSKRVMAADMVALMAQLGFARFGLAGHDRGGRVGYRLCLDHPALVTRFAAIDIIPTLDAWDRMNADNALATYHWQFLAVPAPVPERMIGADPDFYFDHLLDRWAGHRDRLDPLAVADYLAQYHDPAAIAASCEDYRAGATVDRAQDAGDRAAGNRIACPVLVLWGRGYLGPKAASPLSVWQGWADDVREVALDCGHFVVEEEPEPAAAALAEFFAEGR
ncbi:MAG: alpha/beta hydrolase [Alphaproteobacteria bacterium]|nr:alpha/beta hydrolase [Alphaproteobacteria bacterium]MBU0795738.1 alpha/beta hydrolase [Alphaproteobacteria bacterium]MBU0887361.1 alpha/beta hydrolase [Alphaproteobacteria bacterium]MBU1811758.1 alpha/beta hydrolase [Alphaproteobacteria bacterium]